MFKIWVMLWMSFLGFLPSLCDVPTIFLARIYETLFLLLQSDSVYTLESSDGLEIQAELNLKTI